MEVPMIATVIALAIALAVFAGAWAARLLLRAAETRTRADGGGGDER